MLSQILGKIFGTKNEREKFISNVLNGNTAKCRIKINQFPAIYKALGEGLKS